MAAKANAMRRKIRLIRGRRFAATRGRKVGISRADARGTGFFKQGPPLPPPTTDLTPEGHKRIKTGAMERHVLPSDTRNVRSSPFRTASPIF
jgi:hypothetical protein